MPIHNLIFYSMICTHNLKNIIRTNGVFEEEILDEFISIFSEKTIQKKEYFIETGQTIKKVAFICEGIFRSYYVDVKGKEVNQAFLLKNDFMVSKLKAASKSLVNIQAISEAKILVADTHKMNSLVNKYHSITKMFLKIVSMYFDKNQEREVKLRIQNATENYEYFLKEYPNLINKIPHYFIASHLQISSTHLSRIRKMVTIGGSQIL